MSERVGRGAATVLRSPRGPRGGPAAPEHLLRLYVAGTTAQSAGAIRTIRAMCEEHLRGRYRLEVIDVYQRPALARSEQVVATPTLIRERPRPLRRLIGDLSDERVRVGLALRRR